MLHKSISIVLLALALFASFSGCKKSEDNSAVPNNTSIPKGISATINGVPFTATSAQLFDHGSTMQLVGASGLNTTAKALSIVFKKSIGVIDMAKDSVLTLTYSDYATTTSGNAFGVSKFINGSSGTLNLSSVSSSSAIGTFNCIGASPISGNTNTIVITDGKFNVSK